MILRPYQVEAAQAVETAFTAGLSRVLVEKATGLGKTVLFSAIAQREVEAGGRVLVLAHRTELLEQARKKLQDAGCWAEIEQAGRRAGLASVVVASVQTLKGARLEAFDPNAFTLIIVDEAHHAAAKGYRTILDYFASAKVLGVTATADRGDGAGLDVVFEKCVYRYELRQAIRDGYLAPIVCRRIDVKGVDLSAVKTRAGDLAANELGAIMADEAALHGVAIPLLKEAGDRKTIVFCVDVAHAHALAEVLNRYDDGCARAVDGTADADERSELLAAFRRGDFRILVNCALFTEGFDEPGIQCVAMARPTKSRALYAQCIGRGTRPLTPPMEDTVEERCAAIAASAKPNVLVLDFSGNAGRHRLVGPADVLAGRALEEDVKALVDAVTGEEQLELDGLLDHVEDELAKKRAERKVTAVANYLATEVNPWVSSLPEVEIPDAPWTREPATQAQIGKLNDMGAEKLPPDLTKGEASRLIEQLHQRRLAGLCSLKQARMIKRYTGVDATNMSKGEAGRRVQEIISGFGARRAAAKGGWR